MPSRWPSFSSLLAGIPPLVGFLAKIYLFNAALLQGLLRLAIVAAINSALALSYYLRVIARIYLSPAKGHPRKRSQPWLDALNSAAVVINFRSRGEIGAEAHRRIVSDVWMLTQANGIGKIPYTDPNR